MCLEGDEILWSWSVFQCALADFIYCSGRPKHGTENTLKIKLIECLEIWKQATHLEGHLWICEPGTLKERKRTQRFFGVQTQTEEIAREGAAMGPRGTVRSLKRAGKASQAEQLVWDLKGTRIARFS